MSLGSFGQRKSLLIIYAKLFLNTIINGKSQTLLSDFFEDRGGCTQATAIADHIRATGHNIMWDHFDILASGKTDYHCKIKETLLIQELKPALNVNFSSEKLILY